MIAVKISSGNNLTAVLVPATGPIIGSTVGSLFASGSWPFHLGLLAAGVAIGGGLIAWWMRAQARSRKALQRHFEAICRLDPHDCCGDGAGVPALPAGNRSAAIAQQVSETILRLRRRIEELEHSRTASGIRLRRAAAESTQIKAIFSELAEPILAIDEYNEVVLANRRAGDLFHLDAADTEGRILDELVHCQKLVDLLRATSRRKTPGERTDEIEIVDDDGKSHWYRATASKLGITAEEACAGSPPGAASGAGRVAGGAVAVLRDVGDQKELQKRNAEFVSAVSHEMKTPLAGIKAYVELLADGDAEDEETQEEFLGVINSQADRLQRLVDNMLNIARIEAGVINVSKHTQSLNELLEEALHVVQPAAEAKQIELIAELSPMYLGVLADRDMLLQAAINLLSNAIKYTAGGGCVTLRSRMVDDEVRFEVQDTGVGLSDEDCRRVFDKFYRVKKDKAMASGTGLGLPLAKHIVEDVHSGRLTVESTLGEGSTFAATLPGAGQLDS